MAEAKERLLEAVRAGETIVMFGETIKASVSPEGEVYKVEVTGYHPKGFPHWNEETSVASWEGPEVDEAAKRVTDALAGVPAKMMQEVIIPAEKVVLADLVWVTKPYDKLSDAPENIRELDGAKLTLAQVNWIANMADGLKGKEGIESPWAVAKAQFKKAFKKEGDKWVKPKEEEKKKEEVEKELCPKCEASLKKKEIEGELSLELDSELKEIGLVPFFESRLHLLSTMLADQLYGAGKIDKPTRMKLSSAIGQALEAYTVAMTDAPPVVVDGDAFSGDLVPPAHAKFWHSKEEPTARMFLAVAKAYLQRRESETVVWQEGDKRFYLGLVSLPSIKDKEGEVVTAEGADCSIAVSRKYGYHSGLYIKHVVPKSLVGRSLHERRIGPFWVEFGEFKNTPLADWAYRILEKDKEGKWRFSIGFITPKKQALAGRYTRLLKFDSTITEVPAQPLTAMLALMKKEGGTIMEDQVRKLMTFLNPETDEEKAQLPKILAEIFEEVGMKELETIAKQSEGEGKVKEAIEALPDDSPLKAVLAKALEGEVGEPPPKKEEVSAKAVIEEALVPLVASVKDLVTRVEKVEASAGAAALQELREALLTRSQHYPKPSDDAPPVADGAEILKQLEKMLNPGSVGKHPLAGMGHGPGPAEGG